MRSAIWLSPVRRFSGCYRSYRGGHKLNVACAVETLLADASAWMWGGEMPVVAAAGSAGIAQAGVGDRGLRGGLKFPLDPGAAAGFGRRFATNPCKVTCSWEIWRSRRFCG